MNKAQFLAITIPGKPFGKQRPKFSTQGKYVRAITPKETVSYENLVRLTCMEYMKRKKLVMFPVDSLLEVAIVAYYAIPKGTSKKKQDMMISGQIRPGKKPDADNIAKVICDALNGYAYKDDNAIASLRVEKRYADIPRVFVFIKALQEING